jgi:hypothetical protein
VTSTWPKRKTRLKHLTADDIGTLSANAVRHSRTSSITLCNTRLLSLDLPSHIPMPPSFSSFPVKALEKPEVPREDDHNFSKQNDKPRKHKRPTQTRERIPEPYERPALFASYGIFKDVAFDRARFDGMHTLEPPLYRRQRMSNSDLADDSYRCWITQYSQSGTWERPEGNRIGELGSGGSFSREADERELVLVCLSRHPRIRSEGSRLQKIFSTTHHTSGFSHAGLYVKA